MDKTCLDPRSEFDLCTFGGKLGFSVLIDVFEVPGVSAVRHDDSLLLEDDAVQTKRQTIIQI